MSLKIDPIKALDKIVDYINRVDELLEMNYKEGSNKKSDLDSEIKGFLTSAFKNGDKKGYTSSPAFYAGVIGYTPTENEKQEDYISSLNRMRKHLIRFRSEVTTIIDDMVEETVIDDMVEETTMENKVLDVLEKIFSTFNRVERQLRQRHANKHTLIVKDEYDVQDLLHAILKIFFSDIRPEEPTPSFAGNHRRMDFLLKPEKTVIEVKMAKKNLRNKKISEQLNDDINTYKSHTDCDTLVCFIYDPEGCVKNPVGFEKDLSNQSSDKLVVKVYIYPKIN